MPSTEADALIRALVRPAVQEMRAYHVPPARGLIKLDAMENPYSWPQAVREQWLGALRDAEINRYPDPQAADLKAALRRSQAIPDAADLLLGNGSDELIQLLGMALGGESRTVLSPGPGFAMYRLIAGFTGMEFVEVPLRGEDFALDMPAMRRAIAECRPAIIYLAYPNNPTGNAFDAEQVREILDLAPGVVVLDEAYHAFCGESFIDLVPDRPQLLVMRTLSKMGLAGLRLGFLVAQPAWIRELEKCRLPYNINTLTQRSTLFALEHETLLEEQTARIRADRELLLEQLQRLPAVVKAWPSRANFITFRSRSGSAATIHARLRESGILIKCLDGSHPLLHDCLRVTVGSTGENRAFVDALAAVGEG
ncbi:histidinol-phosphate transaminase [Methylonatrum kenyense]|uniref:histidinol-phosphate transaminase n=1 Tax=Methylonatrum kenyense TaxID=455253 RepID=UPI0020C062C2|nr:histidinol-phosphate transaminase [Methylonatrum kenyense]MCK8516271.1 histidinol-phosphate transaminase [Methylonatrum kenyense]